MSEQDPAAAHTSTPRDDAELSLIAYVVTDARPAELRPSPAKRVWMDETADAFAYRCLPLVMASQLGWEALCPVDFRAVWRGGPDASDVEISFPGEASPLIESHFGHGILTLKTGHLFRTPPGHNLWVKGPQNRAKDGIAPLEGLVESDWGPFTFTMNWRFTRPEHEISFEAGEPFMALVPSPRGYLERFVPSMRPIAADPVLQAQFLAWRDARNAFNEQIDVEGTEASVTRWQKHYMRGSTPDGDAFAEHARRLALRAFTNEDSGETP